jgi:hypothetical protein
MSTVSPATGFRCFLFSFLSPYVKTERTFASMEGTDPIAAASAMPFDVI